MTEANEEIPIKHQQTDYFPHNSEVELQRLKEILKGKEVITIPLGDAGYIVHNANQEIVAEAPWVLLDFDDTAARATQDKRECWNKLQEMGIPEEVIQYCDKVSRIDFGRAGVIYEPELEMRLVSLALDYFRSGKSDIEELRKSLKQARATLVGQKNLDQYEIDEEVSTLYRQTRYTSSLYPDTISTLQRLRGGPEKPANIAILTYGDPEFQLIKTVRLLDEERDRVSQIWLSRVRKGDFFKTLLQLNPFRALPIKYTYPETPRNVGINFSDLQVMVTLFDDDPKQIESFNEIAQQEGIVGLGVIRVRRKGTKRSERDIRLGQRVGEIHPSDSYLDSNLYEATIRELSARMIEDFLLNQIQTHGDKALKDPKTPNLIEAIADYRGIASREARDSLLSKSGLARVGTFPTDDRDVNVEIWAGEKRK